MYPADVLCGWNAGNGARRRSVAAQSRNLLDRCRLLGILVIEANEVILGKIGVLGRKLLFRGSPRAGNR
jgi:hypothetical protein